MSMLARLAKTLQVGMLKGRAHIVSIALLALSRLVFVVPDTRRNGYLVTAPTRWTKADNGRTLPLNSAAWRRLRAQVLNEVPLCEYCPAGALTPAVAVDHKDNNPANNTRTNLVSCCVSCHSIKTVADMHGTVARMGCDADGNPIASGHHWNKPAVSRSSGVAEPATDSPEIARDFTA